VSDQTQARIDTEINNIVADCYAKAKSILESNREDLDLVASELIKRETLTGEDFEKLLKKEKSDEQATS